MNPLELVWWALALGAVILISAISLVVAVAAIRSLRPRTKSHDSTHIVGGRRDSSPGPGR